MLNDKNQPICLLYVEDNVFQKEIIRKMFLLQSSIRIDLNEAGSLRESLEFCKFTTVDVVLMDLNLPDSLGINSIKVFKEVFPHIPLMVLTSNDEIDLMKEAATYGVHEFMVKGTFDENLLARQVLFCFEKSKLEKKLREKDSKYRFIVENLHEGFLIVNKEGIVTYANERITSMLDYTEGEMIGTPFVQIVNPLFNGKSEFFLRKFLDNENFRHDFQLIKKDGTFLSVSSSSKSMMDDKGEYNGFTMLIEDLSHRKKTEAELSRLASYPHLNPSPIDEIDCTGKVIFQNKASMNLFKDLPVLKFKHPWLEGVEKIIEDFKASDVSHHLRKVSVEGKFYNQYLHYLPETNSIRIYGTDVTTLEQIMGDFSEKSLFYEKLMDTIPLPIYCKDVKGRYTECNQAFEKFIKYSKKSLLGKTVYDVIPEDAARFQDEKDKELLHDLKDQNYEFNYTDQNGNPVNHLVHKAVYRDSHDQITGIIGIITDIAQQKQYDRKLKSSEALYRAIVEIPFTHITRWNPDTTLTFVNTSYAEAIGISKENLIGRKWIDFIPEDSRGIVMDKCKSMTENPQIDSYELKAEGVRGMRWIMWTNAPIFNENGELTQFQSVGQDITSRKKAEEELKRAYEELSRVQGQVLQSEKMASIGQLAAGVAHEINNPVGFVMSNISTLKEYIASFIQILNEYERLLNHLSENRPGDISDIISNIKQCREKMDMDYILKDIPQLISESLDGTRRIKEIVQSLKSFARTDDAQIKEYDINEGIEATLKIVWNELKYKCELVKNLAPLPLIRCYPGQLNQVFMNMLVNAAQAIRDHGTITVSSAYDKGFICVKISDTGSGISKDNLSKIFDPFFTTKEVGKGTGLGLSISYGIIQRHKGYIEVESEVGKGSTFTIKIPDTGI